MASRARMPLSDLINLLRDGKRHTRSELAGRTGRSIATISQQLQTLEKFGIVARAEGLHRTGGRPANTYVFVPTVGAILAVDLGVRHATLAVTDLTGNPLKTATYPIDIADGPDIILPDVIRKLDELVQSVDMTGRVAGVGMGIPGPVEQSTGRPSTPPIMPGWDHYDIVDSLSRHYSAPAFVDNDANLLAVGERRSVYPEVDDLIYVKVASGVGSGVITGGALIHGAQGAAGDLGHVFSALAHDRQCRCGNVGCVETVAGGIGVAKVLSEAGIPAHNAGDVAMLARSGNLDAIRALRVAGLALGEVLSTCIAILNPRLIVLGGELATAGESLIAGVRQVVFTRTLPLAGQDLQVVTARSGDLGGVIGAAHLVIERVFEPHYLDQQLTELAID